MLPKTLKSGLLLVLMGSRSSWAQLSNVMSVIQLTTTTAAFHISPAIKSAVCRGLLSHLSLLQKIHKNGLQSFKMLGVFAPWHETYMLDLQGFTLLKVSLVNTFGKICLFDHSQHHRKGLVVCSGQSEIW